MAEDHASKKPRLMLGYDQQFVLNLASQNLIQSSNSISVRLRRFRSKFGTSPQVVVAAWKLVDENEYPPLPGGTKKLEHMLWALMLLKEYGTEEDLAEAAGVDEKTFRKWAWLWAEKLSWLEMDLIHFENRKIDDEGNDCMLSVDGTDFQISESGRQFYSFKFKKSALRYEVALNIKNGWICWIHGPFAPKKWPDINIFRCSLKSYLEEGERVEADDGYVGEAPCRVKCPKSISNDRSKLPMQGRARSRQETVNKRFKQFGCLSKRFRHDTTQHSVCFRAVVALTQLSIMNLEPLFEVEYSDNIQENK